MLQKAFRIAQAAHMNQVDKAGKPYILHPIRVAQNCTFEDEKIVALLHDTIEDTDVTAEYLLAEGFSKEIVEGILSVTKREGESYEDFILRAKKNRLGRVVKLYDLKDNMDVSRLNSLTTKDFERLHKYIKAYQLLSS